MPVTRAEREQIGSVHGVPSHSHARRRRFDEKDRHRRDRERETDQDRQQQEGGVEARRIRDQPLPADTHVPFRPLALWTEKHHRASDSPYARTSDPHQTANTGFAIEFDNSGELAALARSADTDLARYGIEPDEMPMVASHKSENGMQRLVPTGSELKKEKQSRADQQVQQPTTMPGGLDSLRGHDSADELDLINNSSPPRITRRAMEKQAHVYQEVEQSGYKPVVLHKPTSRTAPPPLPDSSSNQRPTSQTSIRLTHAAAGTTVEIRSQTTSSTTSFAPPRRAILPVRGTLHSQRDPLADNLSGSSLPQQHQSSQSASRASAPNTNGRHAKSRKLAEDDDHSSTAASASGRGRVASGSREAAGMRKDDAIEIEDDEMEERPRHEEPADRGRRRPAHQHQRDEMVYTAADARNGVHHDLGLTPGGPHYRPQNGPSANGKPIEIASERRDPSTQHCGGGGLDFSTKRTIHTTPPPSSQAGRSVHREQFIDLDDDDEPAPARGEDPDDRISSRRTLSPEAPSLDPGMVKKMLADQLEQQRRNAVPLVDFSGGKGQVVSKVVASGVARRMKGKTDGPTTSSGSNLASSVTTSAVAARVTRDKLSNSLLHGKPTPSSIAPAHPPAKVNYSQRSSYGASSMEPIWHTGLGDEEEEEVHIAQPVHLPVRRTKTDVVTTPTSDVYEIPSDHSHAPSPPPTPAPVPIPRSVRRPGKNTPAPPLSSSPDNRQSLGLAERYATKRDEPEAPKTQTKKPPRSTFSLAVGEVRAQNGKGRTLGGRTIGDSVREKAEAFDALDGVGASGTRRASREMPPPSTTRDVKGKGKAKGKAKAGPMVVAPVVACAMGDEFVHEDHPELFLVVEPGRLRVTDNPHDPDAFMFLVGSHVITQMQLSKVNSKNTYKPGMIFHAKNSETIPVSINYEAGDAIILQFADNSEWGEGMCAGGWGEVENAIMTMVMNGNKVKVTIFEPTQIPQLFEQLRERRENRVREQGLMLSGHSKSRTGGSAKGEMLNRGSKKDVRAESKQSTLSFTTSRRNSTTTSMADDDVVEETLGSRKSRTGIPADRFYGSRTSGASKSRSVSASASVPEEGEAGPSYAPPIPRKRKASEVIDDEPPEQSFFSEEEEDAGRTGDGTMASMYSGRRTRSSAGLEGMLGVGKPKRPEWEIDRRLPDEVIAVYPPTGPGALNLTRAERFRLDDGEFLNDTLIEYGLKRWLLELQQRDPAKADMVHVFSSFFYKKLNVRKEEDGYQSVRKWTNKVDIFKKRFIIVPINENAHWYLAIVYNPEYILDPPPPQDSPHTRHRLAQEAQENIAAVLAAPSITNTPEPGDGEDRMHVDESVQRNELAVDDPLTPAHDEPEGTSPPEPHEGDNSIADLSMDMHAGDRSGDPLNLIGLPDDDDMDVDDPTPAARPESRYDPKLDEEEEDELVDDVSEKRVMSVELGSGEHPEDAAGTSLKAAENITSGGTLVSEQAAALAGRKTYVFTFDSLGGNHKQVQTKLDYWLLSEAETKRKIPKNMCSRSTAKKFNVPTQPNYCDCGLYLIHFVETFMEDPDKFIVWQLTNWKKNEQPSRNDVWNHKNVETARSRMMEQIENLVAERKTKSAPVGPDQPLADSTSGSAIPVTATTKETGEMTNSTSHPRNEAAEDSESDVELIEQPPKPVPPLKPGRTGRKK